MRLNVVVLACTLASSAFAAPQPHEATRARSATATRASEIAPALGVAVATQIRARADSLRKQGDYEAALEAYEAEMTITGETADGWKHIGWTQKALRRFADAGTRLPGAGARADASVVKGFSTTPGFAFGHAGLERTQGRIVLEAGVVF